VEINGGELVVVVDVHRPKHTHLLQGRKSENPIGASHQGDVADRKVISHNNEVADQPIDLF
jgi:hypothetical protein